MSKVKMYAASITIINPAVPESVKTAEDGTETTIPARDMEVFSFCAVFPNEEAQMSWTRRMREQYSENAPKGQRIEVRYAEELVSEEDIERTATFEIEVTRIKRVPVSATIEVEVVVDSDGDPINGCIDDDECYDAIEEHDWDYLSTDHDYDAELDDEFEITDFNPA